MIERLCVIQNAVVLTLRECTREDLVPSNNHWKLMGEMVEVLKLFETATELVSGEKYPTICYIKPLMLKITTHLTKSKYNESECISQMKSEMLKNFKTRYTDERILNMLNIAAMLDPVNKNFLHNYSNVDLLTKKAISLAQTQATYDTNANTQPEVIHCTEGQQYELLSKFNNVPGVTEATTSSAPKSASKLTSTHLSKTLYDDQDMLNPSVEYECLEQDIEYEVRSYFKYKVKDEVNADVKFDILKWWKDHNVSKFKYAC